MPRYQSFSSVLRGTMTGVGNTLGLTGNPSSGSAGAYITPDTTVNAGAGWPNGTTLNSNLALSFGQLNIPGGANPSLGVTVPNIGPGTTATLTFSVQVQC